MAENDESQTHDGMVIRFKTKRMGLVLFRQRFLHKGVNKYTRPFYYVKTVGGVRGIFPLGVTQRTAEKLAEEIAAFLSVGTNTLDLAIAKYNPRRLARANRAATFTDILETYEKALPVIGRKGKPIAAGTFKGYRSSLATMLRKVEAYRDGTEFESFMGRSHVDFSPWFDQSVEILTTKFAMDFKLASLPPPAAGEDEADEEEILTAKITADSTLRCARALFSKQARRYYNAVGLKLPDITGFMSEPDFGATKYFQILPPEVIVGIMRASLDLRMADVDAFRAYLLCMHCGLRRGEASAFKESWLREDERPMIYVTIGGSFNPKHGHGRKAAIAPWVMKALKELGPVVNPAQALANLHAWVKSKIPAEHAVNKPVHELRKCWVSFKAKEEGVLAAAQQAGHKDVKVTQTNYADNLLPDRLSSLWKESTETAILKFKAA